MPIHIYNSLTRKKEEFIPLEPLKVKMYVCGPTVYDAPHIGHARSAYIFDVIRRYLAYRGFKVKFVRNVTDVDDKIIDKANKVFPGKDLKASCEEVARIYLDEYHEALKSLSIDTGAEKIIEPKASAYIPKMIEFIADLIKKEKAYASGGDVYFDITKAKDYGKLSNQSLDKMESGARITANENKRNPLDFALWKTAKENEPSWPSPWGNGRPGWHIECSVMSSDILGDEFDIHGGGIDLIFPHHENETAQSEGAGKKFARYWIHHGLLTINGQKMSKSLGNFITVEDFINKYQDADLLKLLFLFTHYAHPVDYTDEKVREAKQALERIRIFQDKASGISVKQPVGDLPEELKEVKAGFIKAMDDDFNTPQALAGIFDLVNVANKNIADANFVLSAMDILKELSSVFGISGVRQLDLDESLEARINEAINARLKARKERNFALADEIRKDLEAEGIILEDTKGGTTWRKKL